MIDIMIGSVVVVGFLALASLIALFMIKTFAAKSRWAYWRNLALIVVFVMATNALMNHFDPIPPEALARPTPSFSETIAELIAPLSTPQRAVLGAYFFAIVAVGVGSWVLAIRRERRAGRPWWQAFAFLLDPPFRGMTVKDWLLLFSFAAVSMGLLIWAFVPRPK